MASYIYQSDKKSSYHSRATNVIDLIKKSKLEEKKEKKNTIIIAFATLSVLAISLVFIITF